MKKIIKFFVVIFSIFLISIISIGLFSGNLIYNMLISSNPSKQTIYADYIYNTTFQNSNWLTTESNYKEKYITSYDNVKLHAYVIKQNVKTSKWAIVIHGYGEEGKLVSRKALHFYQMGYNVLVPDLRGNGKSQGKYIGMGYKDRLDIIKWSNSIVSNDAHAEIVLHGTSMGACTVLLASNEKSLPTNVKAIIADSAYTSLYDLFNYDVKKFVNIPAFPLNDFTNLFTILKAGYSLKDVSPINVVSNSKTPILYIHGNHDKIVPAYMNEELFKQTSSPKEKLYIKNGEHAKADLADSTLYWSTIENFLNKYITS